MKEKEVVEIIFGSDGGFTGDTVGAVKLSPNRYELVGTPQSSANIPYGTVVEAAPDRKGKLIFKKIVRLSQYDTFRYLVPSRDRQDAGKIDTLKNIITTAGGDCEQVMGGILIIHLPKSSGIDLAGEMKKLNLSPMPIADDGR